MHVVKRIKLVRVQTTIKLKIVKLYSYKATRIINEWKCV